MGQKSNVNTLRKLTHSNITYNTEKLGLINVSIIKYLRFLFKKKGVLILNYSINKIDNKIYISLDLFFTTKKLNQYRKCKKKLNKKKNFFFKKVLYFLKLNAIFIKVRNMNTVIKKK